MNTTTTTTATDQARIDLQNAYDKAYAKMQEAINQANGANRTFRYFENLAAESPEDSYHEDVDRWSDRWEAAEEALLDAERAVAAYQAGLDALNAA